ncbi:MAG: precorrin-2 C(20)-methyltransferase [Caulobacteraceae bacterium]
MTGRLHIVGLGPGDPELMTVKAARLIGEARLIAFFAKAGRVGQARSIVDGLLPANVEELRFDYPFTVEVPVDDPRYLSEMGVFYEVCAEHLFARLNGGKDVVLLCEGDPFFYGSAMYLYDRLKDRLPVEVIPGVTGMSGCWTRAGAPMTHGDDVLSVMPGTLDEEVLVQRLSACDAAVIMKVGRNLAKIGRALAAAGLTERAVYVERGAMAGERILPFAELTDATAPYFSLVLVPGRRRPR